MRSEFSCNDISATTLCYAQRARIYKFSKKIKCVVDGFKGIYSLTPNRDSQDPAEYTVPRSRILAIL